MRVDVIVVGCGPTGSLASLETARSGINVVVLEEHRVVGEPNHCAGLLSTSGLKRLGLKVPEECILNRVYGARFFSPSNVEFTVERETVQAVVLDRRRFDKWLASLAQDAGAQLFLGERAVSLNVKPKCVAVNVRGGQEIIGEVVIDAEGYRGKIAELAGLPRPVGRLPAVQLELAGVDVDEDFVELHFSNKLAPGFFAWVIPTDFGARVGLGARSNPGGRIKAFIRRRGFSGARVVRRMAGVIITGGPVRRTSTRRVVTVGDAAGQVKPTSGGGVITGGICAKIAGRVVSKAVLEGETDEPLREYERTWRGLLGREFFFMGLARRLLNVASDKVLDSVFRVMREHGGAEILETYGDMDFESVALKRILANPRMLLRALTALIT